MYVHRRTEQFVKLHFFQFVQFTCFSMPYMSEYISHTCISKQPIHSMRHVFHKPGIVILDLSYIIASIEF